MFQRYIEVQRAASAMERSSDEALAQCSQGGRFRLFSSFFQSHPPFGPPCSGETISEAMVESLSGNWNIQ